MFPLASFPGYAFAPFRPYGFPALIRPGIYGLDDASLAHFLVSAGYSTVTWLLLTPAQKLQIATSAGVADPASFVAAVDAYASRFNVQGPTPAYVPLGYGFYNPFFVPGFGFRIGGWGRGWGGGGHRGK